MPHKEWAPDGIHLNLKGETEYAAWLHRQLDAIYAP